MNVPRTYIGTTVIKQGRVLSQDPNTQVYELIKIMNTSADSTEIPTNQETSKDAQEVIPQSEIPTTAAATTTTASGTTTTTRECTTNR